MKNRISLRLTKKGKQENRIVHKNIDYEHDKYEYIQCECTSSLTGEEVQTKTKQRKQEKENK